MAIEIRELIIRATVTQTDSGSTTANNGSSINQQEIIQECIGQIAKIIKNKKER
jgi:hypothetical protein